MSDEDDEMVKEMRLKTQRGLVIGAQGFIEDLEDKLGRSLTCLNPGRPKKCDSKR